MNQGVLLALTVHTELSFLILGGALYVETLLYASIDVDTPLPLSVT